MITNISLVTLYVNDQDEAKKFYTDMLGFRWGTLGPPAHPELAVTLMKPGPPRDDGMAEAVRRALADGTMGGFGLRTSDCHKTFAELSEKGVEFMQEPSDRPYGVEAVMRD